MDKDTPCTPNDFTHAISCTRTNTRLEETHHFIMASTMSSPTTTLIPRTCLRTAQHELKAKALLALALSDAEAAQTKTVQRAKRHTETLAAQLRAHHRDEPAKTLMLQGWAKKASHVAWFHRRLLYCMSAVNTTDLLRKNRMEEVVRQRRGNAVRCVEVLKAYLVRVREEQ